MAYELYSKKPMKHKLEITDDFGNRIINDNNKIILCLWHGEKRTIGKLIPNERVLSVKRDRSKHMMNCNDSYGFNYTLLEMATKFDNIRLHDEHGCYIFDYHLILELGEFLFFKNQGFERQIFLGVNEIEKYKI